MSKKIAKASTSQNLALAIANKRAAEQAEQSRLRDLLESLQEAIALWANSSTGPAVHHREELLRKKKSVVESFFADIKKLPGQVKLADVRAWCDKLTTAGYQPTTIYARVSFISSFYTWAQRDPELGKQISHNPTILSRPKAPEPYQTDATKSWTDEELQALVAVVSSRADTGDLHAKRDLALLLLYTSTGWRREEVISLRGRDVRVLDDKLIIGRRVKGGRYRAREVTDPEVRTALLDYLGSAKRMHTLKTDLPIWTRHDHFQFSGDQLTSHAFVHNLKGYATAAGVEHVHLHQTRHTFARIVAEETGSFAATQDALEHQNLSTTTVYVQRIAVKKDLHSGAISRRRRRKTAPVVNPSS